MENLIGNSDGNKKSLQQFLPLGEAKIFGSS
jgi:hypothetical protein